MPLRMVTILPGLALWLLLAVGYALYFPGQQGVWYFDDPINLQGLADVHDGWSALLFLSRGDAGALARPVAMASFLLNWGDWPNNASGFLYTNILIHLLNGVLLTWLVLRLIRLIHPASPDASQRGAWIAVSTATLWLLMPLLASTTLIIIQRMAGLCATFVLAGLLTYLIGLAREIAGRVWRGRGLQALGVGLGTLLAVLTKENGALLPLYVLVLEGTVLAGVRDLDAWRRWRAAFLAMPVVLLLLYVVLTWSGVMAGYAARPFTLGERLLTESVILWDYLRLAVSPRGVAFSPFHDDYPVHSLLWALPALLAWLALLTLAFQRRHQWPWFALAVFWYLGGHLLESTVLPLELYFEHRNYLPLMGPVAALCGWLWTTPMDRSMRRLALAALGGYTLLLATMLWQVTTLWGQPLLAGELWVRWHPASIRATNFLATGYVAIGDAMKARHLLDQAIPIHPTAIDLPLNALILACSDSDPDSDKDANQVRRLYQIAWDRAVTGEYSASVPEALLRIRRKMNQGHCQGLGQNDLHRMANRLLTNPRYTDSSYLHNFLADLYREEKNLDGTLRHLKAAWKTGPELGTAALIVGTMLSAGLWEEARAFLPSMRQHLPRNPVLRSQWLEVMGQLQTLMDQHSG